MNFPLLFWGQVQMTAISLYGLLLLMAQSPDLAGRNRNAQVGGCQGCKAGLLINPLED